jgi:chromosome segregation ATPase
MNSRNSKNDANTIAFLRKALVEANEWLQQKDRTIRRLEERDTTIKELRASLAETRSDLLLQREEVAWTRYNLEWYRKELAGLRTWVPETQPPISQEEFQDTRVSHVHKEVQDTQDSNSVLTPQVLHLYILFHVLISYLDFFVTVEKRYLRQLAIVDRGLFQHLRYSSSSCCSYSSI